MYNIYLEASYDSRIIELRKNSQRIFKKPSAQRQQIERVERRQLSRQNLCSDCMTFKALNGTCMCD